MRFRNEQRAIPIEDASPSRTVGVLVEPGLRPNPKTFFRYLCEEADEVVEIV
jgi:hypothetical protein